MEYQESSIIRALSKLLRCCVAASVCAASSAAAQFATCSPFAANSAGLYSAGSGLLARLSLGPWGTATGASTSVGSAANGTDGGQAACAPGEAASIAIDAPSTLAGNPVDVVTGTKHDRAIDAYLPSPAHDPLDDAAELVFSRFYSSDSPGTAELGPGWRMGLDARLYAFGEGDRRVFQIVQGDGRTVSFGPRGVTHDGSTRYAAGSREDGVLERTANRQGSFAASSWIWRWRNGRQLHFDAGGRLRRIVSPAGSELALDYDDRSRLAAVRTAAGQGLRLRYHEEGGREVGDGGDAGLVRDGLASRGAGEQVHALAGRLAALLDSTGQIARYDYDRAGRLARVEFGTGARVEYVYADGRSRHLVAVVLPDGRRSEYRYSADGRVVYSRAAGDGEALAMRFEARAFSRAAMSGESQVRIGAEVRATYRWQRQRADSPPRLVSAAGPGCERCPATGRRYRYDAQGRVVEVRPVGENGKAGTAQTFTIRRDHAGRPVELQWGRSSGDRARIRWRDDALVDALDRVDWPSVVSGRRAMLRASYDEQGRIVSVEQSGFAPSIGASDGERAPTPGDEVTRVWRDDYGRTVALRSVDSGLVRRTFDEHDRLQLEQRADGSRARYRYDSNGLLVEYRESAPPDAGGTSAGEPDARISLRWEQGRLSGVGNDVQRESFSFDSDGRVAGRRIALALESVRTVEIDTRFEYDGDGRLGAWSLPGGGWIRAVRDPAGQIVSLDWQPAGAALMHPIVSALERDRHGLRRVVFGNGIVATTSRTRSGAPVAITHRTTRGIGRGQDVVGHTLAFDEAGRLAEWRSAAGPGKPTRERRMLYDRHGRLIQATHRSHTGDRAWRFAYDANGNRMLTQELDIGGYGQPEPFDARYASDSHSEHDPRTQRFTTVGLSNRVRKLESHAMSERGVRAFPDRANGVVGVDSAVGTDRGDHAARRWDAAGRLVSDGARSYRWDGSGRLREVGESGRTIARYHYDAWGQRVTKIVDGVATYYVYDTRRRLLAELNAEGEVSRQYVYLADRPVAMLERVDAASRGAKRRAFRIRYLHLNHLGAPDAVTDEQARVIWRADYAPFGRRIGIAPAGKPAFELALRLPGQYEDDETGLHYNDNRYYDPDAGRYLSPDPLGLAAGPNPYVYAGNDPLTRIDPSGLLLFAFDGTDNSDPPPRRDDWSNVYKLSRAYSDGRVWYMSGVGRDDASSGIRTTEIDAITAGSARARVDHMLRELDAAAAAPASRGKFVDVDVIGFSRGAAMARDFSNRVADRVRGGEFTRLGACVRLRFVGLWDTVAQFGVNGVANAAWRLSIPGEVAYAAHAVALNEHRALFPVESIVGSPLAGVRIERGFVGAHADIGGSYAEGDLSDVALIWMHEQARQAGVRMFALTSEFARVSAPLLHDSNLDRFGDREFRYRNSYGWTFANPMQRVARVDGLQWRDTERFIRRYAQPQPDVYGQPTLAGTVEIASYSAWLAANYGIAP